MEEDVLIKETITRIYKYPKCQDCGGVCDYFGSVMKPVDKGAITTIFMCECCGFSYHFKNSKYPILIKEKRKIEEG